MREEEKEFLGAGWKFPVEADRATGKIRMSDQEESIREAIHIIIMTRPGERMMCPEFGCHIHDFLFQRPDYPTRVRMENAVREALLRWEPRIRDIQV
nr:GPW/gp25 family protein [Lachnospiraceae bacterium]